MTGYKSCMPPLDTRSFDETRYHPSHCPLRWTTTMLMGCPPPKNASQRLSEEKLWSKTHTPTYSHLYKITWVAGKITCLSAFIIYRASFLWLGDYIGIVFSRNMQLQGTGIVLLTLALISSQNYCYNIRIPGFYNNVLKDSSKPKTEIIAWNWDFFIDQAS